MDGALRLDLDRDGSSRDGSKPGRPSSYIVPASPTRVGVVFFDANGLSDTGWACVAGDSPYRIKSGFALDTDVVWWSNLSSDQILGRVPKSVRSSRYLKVPMELAVAELGLSQASAEEVAERLAFHFMVIARLIEKISNKPFAHWARSSYLHSDLLPLGGPAPLMDPKAVKSILTAGTGVSWTKIELASNAETICFRVPRLSYALSLLQTSIPEAAVTWRQKPVADPMEAIRTSLAPIYAEYTVQNALAKPAQLFGLANAGDRDQGTGRFVAAHPELLAVEAFSDLKVHALWSGSNYRKAWDSIPPQITEFLSSKPALFSWSAGVVADAIIHGICSPTHGMNKEKNLSYRAVWLRGADKVTMWSNAMGFHKAGYHPTSYGHGWIKVRRPETATANAGLLSVGVRRGLIPDPHSFDPAVVADVARGTYGPPHPDGGWGAGVFPARLCLFNQYHFASEFDDLPLKTPEGRRKAEDALREVLAATSSG
jgi:hypothetical protein